MRRFDKLVVALVEVCNSADHAEKQHEQFLKDDKAHVYKESFIRNERIDNIYLGVLTKLAFSTGNLRCDPYFKKILVLSHGNSYVEFGFPIN